MTDWNIERSQLAFLLGEKLADFGKAVDTKHFDTLLEVFAEDATGNYGERPGHSSCRELIDSMAHNLGEGSNCGASQHNVLNLRLVEHDGDRAVTRSNFYAVHQGLNRFSGQLWSTWGEYLDSWLLTPAGWRIWHRQYHTLFSEGPEQIVSRG